MDSSSLFCCCIVSEREIDSYSLGKSKAETVIYVNWILSCKYCVGKLLKSVLELGICCKYYCSYFHFLVIVVKSNVVAIMEVWKTIGGIGLLAWSIAPRTPKFFSLTWHFFVKFSYSAHRYDFNYNSKIVKSCFGVTRFQMTSCKYSIHIGV